MNGRRLKPRLKACRRRVRLRGRESVVGRTHVLGRRKPWALQHGLCLLPRKLPVETGAVGPLAEHAARLRGRESVVGQTEYPLRNGTFWRYGRMVTLPSASGTALMASAPGPV